MNNYTYNKKKNNKTLINEQISFSEVLLISESGEQMGIFNTKEALSISRDKDLDLVCLSPNTSPPVCKIINYGKFLYSQQKKKRESKKKQKNLVVKEVRLSPTIDSHDLSIKIKHVIKFLTKGDKVKVSVRFRARAITHPEIGTKILEQFSKGVEEYGVPENTPKLEGYQMNLMFVPKK